MLNTWDNFWITGSIGDYLLYCRARQAMEGQEKEKADPGQEDLRRTEQAAGIWQPPKLG